MIRDFKGEPNVYAIRYRNGQLQSHGLGRDFWYLPFNTTIAAVPAMSQDAPFIFNEATANFQAVAIQGQPPTASPHRWRLPSCSTSPSSRRAAATAAKTRRS